MSARVCQGLLERLEDSEEGRGSLQMFEVSSNVLFRVLV